MQNEGMHDRKQTKYIRRERELDGGKEERDREGEGEKYEKEEDKSTLCCSEDFHTHFGCS